MRRNSTERACERRREGSIPQLYDQLPLFCTDINNVSQLQQITFIANSQNETVLCGGPCSLNFDVRMDEEGKSTVSGKVEVS